MAQKKKTDRELVREFFDWQWPAAPDDEPLRTGAAVAASGFVGIAGYLIYGRLMYGPETERSDFWLAGLVLSIAVAAVGVHFVRGHYRATDLLNLPAARLLAKVHECKIRDLTKIWRRSFETVGKDISELRNFNLVDSDPFGWARIDVSALMPSPEIMNKSIVLLGPVFPVQQGRVQIGLSRDGPTVEFNPVSISILYTTGTQLIVYRAVVDLMTGDLHSESLQRVNAFEIIQVKIQANYKREENPVLSKIFARVGSLKEKELVLTETQVHIAMTGARAIDLPVGALSVQAKKGELDREGGASQHREARIARALDQYIEAAKAVTQQPGVPALR